MSTQKRTYSLDERACAYVDRRAKRLKRSASSVVSEIILERLRDDARAQVIHEYGKGVDLSDEVIDDWAKRMGLE